MAAEPRLATTCAAVLRLDDSARPRFIFLARRKRVAAVVRRNRAIKPGIAEWKKRFREGEAVPIAMLAAKSAPVRAAPTVPARVNQTASASAEEREATFRKY